ncbi:MAG: carboxypeptidase regulatory-like domain-containing protein [Acidobacteria bacterium]|nr:carboxypeptidase regulatory-like domain-containing protein [Acidobacteriota bacterium]
MQVTVKSKFARSARLNGLIALALSLASLLAPLPAASARAGGEVAGTVTDPKGAVVVGATVTVTDPVSGQSYTAITDGQGRYKIEGLPAGTYTVTVLAEGFKDARQEAVRVEEGKTASFSVKLELSALAGESVTVTAAGVKGNTDPVYREVRQLGASAGDFSGDYASVSNLVLKRDAATFTLKSGEVYFLRPVEGRITGGVFVGEGELTLTPPTETERQSLAIFADAPTLTEQFTTLVMRFGDRTFDEVRASPAARVAQGGPQAERARGLYRENQSLLRKQLRSNAELRTLTDIYSTAHRPGYFTAFVGGKRFNKLVYEVDPLGLPYVSPEQVALTSHGTTDGGIWTAFYMADEYRAGRANSNFDRRLVDISHHEIDAALKGARLVVTDRMTLKARQSGARVLPFDLYPGLRVTRVQDEQGADLNFIQESKNEDGDFGVIFAQQTQAAKTYKLTVQYEGDGAVRDFGGGNFALVTRSNWYPSGSGTQFGDRATFDITFRYPKGNVFVATGALSGPETEEGDVRVARWSSGKTELAVAGFNYGKFKKKEEADPESGYTVEFFANTSAAPLVRQLQNRDKMVEMITGQSVEQLSEGEVLSTGTGATTGSAGEAIAQTKDSMRIFNAYFGKLPYTRVALTQQPAGNYGQSWPTLVYMPYTAFMDPTERLKLFSNMTSGQASQVAAGSFWSYLAAHELAHQWWGHIIGWTSYHDQWMSEGFAEFSSSLYVQYVRKDVGKFVDFWEEQRKLIVEASPATKGRRPYTVGPITQGYRLNSGKTGGVARRMIYPKGAYVLHMLRMMMWDTRNPNRNPDERFQAMMKDFVQTHYNKDVSTEDFKRIVDKHVTQDNDLDENRRMDWFFNQWVYGTDVPTYRFEYTVSGNSLSGRVTQSGVSDKFKMRVPLYVDFGKGWVRLGSVTLNGNTSFDIPATQLPQAPRRAAIAALNDVLAVQIENVKR